MKSIAAFSLVAVLFSCESDVKEIRNLLEEKNLPIGMAKKIVHVYKDSGRITSKLKSPLLFDFSNRTDHPYNEFPNGIKIITFENKGKDSITILGDYALTYSKTKISELKGNVVVINHTDESRLETDQLFWDQNTDYFYTEKKFILITKTDLITGVGFESKKDLSKHVAKKMTGDLETIEN